MFVSNFFFQEAIDLFVEIEIVVTTTLGGVDQAPATEEVSENQFLDLGEEGEDNNSRKKQAGVRRQFIVLN